MNPYRAPWLVLSLFATLSVTAATEVVAPRLRCPPGPCLALQRIELGVDEVPDAPNPFDPDAARVEVQVRTPSGKALTLPAFWSRDYERRLDGNREVLTATNAPGWRVRYLPLEPGAHTLTVTFQGRADSPRTSPPVTLTVAPGQGRGLIRRDAGSRYFRYDDGTPLFLNGLCACWHGSRGTYDYDDWLAAYEQNGINYIRLWMWPQAFGIEWDKGDRLNYRLDTAWTLDRVLAEAERRGIVVMLCLDYHGMFEVKPDYWKSNNYWPRHPYNSAHGGPCPDQDSFFTLEAARELYRKRLRYIVARWSAFPNLLAWEFFNEIDNEYSYLKHDHVIAWHQSLGAALRALDPYQHLISSSFTGNSERPDLFALPEMDFAQYHSYNEKHPAAMTAQKTAAFWERYHKPFFVSEYGTDWKGWKPDTDPHLRALHQAIWSAPFTGAAGTGMTWWWESIHGANLYHHWSALAGFLKGTAIAARDMQPVCATARDNQAQVWAVATPQQALVWILNPARSWPEGAQDTSPTPLEGVEVTVHGLADGDAQVEWWDTLAGKTLRTAPCTIRQGQVSLPVPGFATDIAGRLRRR